MKIDLNELARRVCMREGKKKETNIAQVKEVIRCAMDEAALAWVDQMPVPRIRVAVKKKGKRKCQTKR